MICYFFFGACFEIRKSDNLQKIKEKKIVFNFLDIWFIFFKQTLVCIVEFYFLGQYFEIIEKQISCVSEKNILQILE